MIEGTRKGGISWTRRLLMPIIIILVAVVLWSRGPSSEEATARVQGMVEVLLNAANSDSGKALDSFIDREAVAAIAEVEPPRVIEPVQDLSDHSGERYACRVSGSGDRAVRLEFSGNPAVLRSVHRISAD